MSKAVEGGQLKSVSPTQITEYLDCPRKWWFSKVAGLKPGASKSQELGERIHNQMEAYFREGVAPSHPSCQAALRLKVVPDRSPEVVVEEPRNYHLALEAGGVPVRGRIDLMVPPRDGHVRIIDWKSCKDWRYIKRSEELARNPQGVIYLQFAFSLHKEARTGEFGHVYLRTRGGSGVRPVFTGPLYREEVAETYTHLEAVVREMKATATAPAHRDVPANLGACGKYGGCPYLQACQPTSRRIEDLLSLYVPREDELSKEADRKLEAFINARRAPSKGITPPDAPASTTKAVEGKPIEVLYINALPEGSPVPVLRLEDLISERTPAILALLRERNPAEVSPEVADLREVPYGGGTAALVASFRRSPPRGRVAARSEGLAGAVLEVLVPLATEVVRGLR